MTRPDGGSAAGAGSLAGAGDTPSAAGAGSLAGAGDTPSAAGAGSLAGAGDTPSAAGAGSLAGADLAAGAALTRPQPSLSERLAALSGIVEVASRRSGPDGFTTDLIADAAGLVDRAGARLRLSADHTVVALAGGTGSGKSSLFNRLAGADFSVVGMTRPVTDEVHACVWGISGSGPLLEWLAVPRRHRYARASALDLGEKSLAGLVLLDLPDHDSVVARAGDRVSRIIAKTDLMLWVLDPQKYADAAVHRGYLVPMAGHAEVVAVVLNQSDLLSAAQVEECVGDLRRLLDAEDLHEAQIVVTSALTGAGMDELRKILVETVLTRRAASVRLAADIQAMVKRFEPYAGASVVALSQTSAGSPPVMPDTRQRSADLAARVSGLAERFAQSAGVTAIGDTLASARELRAIDYVGWPVGWFVDRMRRGPTRKIRLGQLWTELRGVTASPSGAQQAEIDIALADMARMASEDLPPPWSGTVNAALRSQAAEIPAALGAVVSECLPRRDRVAGWWRWVGVVQGLLLGLTVVGIAWLILLTIFGALHVGSNMPRLLSDLWLMPWIGAAIIGMLALGSIVASASMTGVREEAARERRRFAEVAVARMSDVAVDLALGPTERELAEFDRFRIDLATIAVPSDVT